MTINYKSERNYRGKCLGWPVTSYGAVLCESFVLVTKSSHGKVFIPVGKFPLMETEKA